MKDEVSRLLGRNVIIAGDFQHCDQYDAAVDRMTASIQKFGFKIPMLARSSGEVVDRYLRLKAARRLSITDVPDQVTYNLDIQIAVAGGSANRA